MAGAWPRDAAASGPVGIQRASPDEAAQIGRIMHLPRLETEALSTLADGVTLGCNERNRQFVMTQATGAETGLLGSARRMDRQGHKPLRTYAVVRF